MTKADIIKGVEALVRKVNTTDESMEKISYLSACQEKETSAWNRFYRDHVSIIYKWVLFLGINESNAEEVAQEVFLTAYRKIDTCDSEEQLKSWLFQITRRQAANYRRSAWFRRIWNHSKTELADQNTQDRSASSAIASEMRQLLSSLPSKLTEVLLLHDLEGFTQGEIARMLDVPQGTIASRLRCARQRFSAEWWEEK